jgi:hypothetical protein
MNQDCQKISNNLIDIVENNLSESLEKAILDHLAVCPRCQRLVEDFVFAWKKLSTADKASPSHGFLPELIARIQAHEQPQPTREKMMRIFINALRPAAVSVILIGGIFIGYQLGNFPNMESSRTEMPAIGLYAHDFQDFPEGSAGDFLMKFELPIQEEKP